MDEELVQRVTTLIAGFLVIFAFVAGSCRANESTSKIPLDDLSVSAGVAVAAAESTVEMVAANPLPPTKPIAIPVAPTRFPVQGAQRCGERNLQKLPDVVIGAIYPPEYPSAHVDAQAMQTAVHIAIDEVNAAGGIHGKKLLLAEYGANGSIEQTKALSEKLITSDCAVLLIGGYFSDMARVIKEVAVQHHTPFLLVGASADDLTSDLASEVFRLAPSRTMIICEMAKWATTIGDYNQNGKTSAVLLVDDTESGEERIQIAKQWFPQYQIDLTAFKVEIPVNNDFSPTITRIVALDEWPDIIFIQLHHEAIFELQQQLLDAGIRPDKHTLLVTTGAATNDQLFWQRVPLGAYTIVMNTGPWPTALNIPGQQFVNAFRTRTNSWPSFVAFTAYDAVQIGVDAMRRSNQVDGDALIQALEETSATWAAGHYSFPFGARNRPDGKETPYFMWHQWAAPPIFFLQYHEQNDPIAEAAILWPTAYNNANGPLVAIRQE